MKSCFSIKVIIGTAVPLLELLTSGEDVKGATYQVMINLQMTRNFTLGEKVLNEIVERI